MNRNTIKELSKIIADLKDEEETFKFLNEILTESEIEILSKRWRILTMLGAGVTQREIAKSLNVSLCNVTRGAKILKTPNSIIKNYLKGRENANNQ